MEIRIEEIGNFESNARHLVDQLRAAAELENPRVIKARKLIMLCIGDAYAVCHFSGGVLHRVNVTAGRETSSVPAEHLPFFAELLRAAK